MVAAMLLITPVQAHVEPLKIRLGYVVPVTAKRGTMALVGLPPGSFELDIFNTVLMRKTIRGSIVGTRLDLAECLQFAGDGKVKVHYSVERL